jgi:hypothetical protein
VSGKWWCVGVVYKVKWMRKHLQEKVEQSLMGCWALDEGEGELHGDLTEAGSEVPQQSRSQTSSAWQRTFPVRWTDKHRARSYLILCIPLK